MYSVKTKKKALTGVLLVWFLSVLLGGCGYTMVPNEYLLQSNEQPVTDQEEEEEEESALTEGEKLRNQLIAMLNLTRGAEERIASSTALDEAVAFCVEVVLEDPQTYILDTQSGVQSMQNILGLHAYLYVYDGTLAYGQVAGQALGDIRSDENTMINEEFKKITSIGVAYGEEAEGAVWVILVKYADN